MKMEKEFNLKEERTKIQSILSSNMNVTAYKTGVKDCLSVVKEQDKEFIEKLKEKIHNKGRYEESEVLFLIDKLAGKELTEEQKD